MSPETKSEIVQTLERGRQEFLAAVSGLTEADAQAHPEAGRWSVLECVEHVTIVEERFLGRLEKAASVGAPPIDRQKEADLAARVPDRTTRAQAPELALPSGRFQNLAEALGAFNAARTATIRFAQERGETVYSLAESHPRFGPLNGMELLVLMNGHPLRHAAQIRELRAELNK